MNMTPQERTSWLSEETQKTKAVFSTDPSHMVAAFTTIHTSGHASPEVLKQFAARIQARYLVPIYSFDWDDHVGEFANVKRLSDGEPFRIG